MTLKGFFNHVSRGIIAGASVLAIAALASRALGFLRNALLAAHFGAGDTLDAYFLAFRLPDLVFNLLFFGALSAGFVPVFMKMYRESAPRAWRLSNDIFNLALVSFTVFGVVFFFAAPWVLPLIAPGFSEATLALAVTMSRIMFLQPIFLGISGIFSGILQSKRKFLSYSLAPIFYNVGIIFGILALVPTLGPLGLAWGVVLGALLHLAVQYPATRESGWRWKPTLLAFWRGTTALKKHFSAVRRVLVVMVPRSLALIVQQVNLIILISMATVLGAGSVAVFNFANDLYSFPLGVVVVPLSVAAFPALVRALDRGKQEMGLLLVHTLRQLLFFMLPLTMLAIVLRAQVVRLTLGYGQFGWEETILTIDTLSLFLVGLVFHGILGLVMRAYFAFEDAKTPLFVLLAGTVVTVVSALLFRDIFGVAGLALAFSVGMIFNSLLLFGILVGRVGATGIGDLARALVIFGMAALGAGIAARWTLFLAADHLIPTQRVWGLATQAGLATIVGVLVYLAVVWIFRMPEIDHLKIRLGLGKEQVAALEGSSGEELPR